MIGGLLLAGLAVFILLARRRRSRAATRASPYHLAAKGDVEDGATAPTEPPPFDSKLGLMAADMKTSSAPSSQGSDNRR